MYSFWVIIHLKHQSSEYPVATHFTPHAYLMRVATALDVSSVLAIYRRRLSHETKGSCQVLIEDMMVVRIFKIRILTEKDQKYFKSPLFVEEYAGGNW